MPAIPGPHEAQITAIRDQHAGACIAHLRDRGPATSAQLSRATGLSRPTVNAIVADLLAVGIAAESAEPAHGGGRPARVFHFEAEARFVIGIDAGVHSLSVMVADLAGLVRAALRLPLDPATPGAPRIGQLRAAAHSALEKAGVAVSQVHCAVVAAPGIVGRDGRVVLSEPIPGFTGLDLSAALGEAMPYPVLAENDVNMAALAESRIGAAQQAMDVVYLHVGHRAAAGIILGGQLHRGRHDAAGELAGMDISAWVPEPGEDPAAVPERVLAQARAGDPAAIARLDAFAHQISEPLTTLATTLDPDLLVVGGGMSQAGPIFTDAMRRAVAARAAIRPVPPLLASTLGDDGVVLGAIVRGLAHVNEHLYRAPALPTPAITRAQVAAPSPADDAAAPRPVRAGLARVSRASASHGARASGAMDEGAQPARPLRVAVVGVGARARFAQHLQRPGSGALLVAAADPGPHAAARAEEYFGPIDVVSSHRELAHLGVDAAIVASPDDTHAAIAADLLGAGIAVFSEKPVATTIEDADAILRVARETGTRLYVGHNMRHMAVVTLLREIIARGEIGEVKAIWCRHFVGNGGDYYFKDWHAERARTTSLLLQKGAHDIDVMHWLAGSVTREVVAMGDLAVYGQVTDRAGHGGQIMPEWFSADAWPPLAQRGLNPTIDVEDISLMLMRMDSGVLASYQQCHFTPDYWRNYTVIGTEGRAENFGDGEGGEVRVWNHRTSYSERGDAVYRITGDARGHDDADVAMLAEFVRFARDGAPTRTSPVAARDAVAAGVMATESLRGGSVPRRVPALDPQLAAYFDRNQRD